MVDGVLKEVAECSTHPSDRNMAVIRGVPYRPYNPANSITRAVSAPS